jgi:Rod binding domain-containing protein
MFDKEVAHKMAQKGGTGLASMLVAHLEKKQADATKTADILQSQGLQTTGQPIPLNPQPQAIPLQPPAAATGLPLRQSNGLPLNLPPKPLGGDS